MRSINSRAAEGSVQLAVLPAEAMSDAQGVQEFNHSETYVRGVAVLAALIGLAYLTWRVGWTLNWDAMWITTPLLLAEIHGFVTFLGYAFMTWDCRPPAKPEPFEGATVDFFIPTYNEPLSVLAPTIAGAVAIDYPHTVYVLDDGRRPWVKRLCKRLGAQYITRPDNAHAKAGNLNHALSVTNGDFVAIVDADFVPRANYISDMLGYFRDPKVAFVQGPQEFYNRDSFQHLPGDRNHWHEQAMFFRAIQVGKNRWNSAFWCGCPSLLRRSALESIGGVQSDTVTEDLHTSLKLHSQGWKSVFHPGIVALGIAPNDYYGFILQRLRWAAGTMQVIRKEWRIRGLSFAQRVSYVSSIGTYFDAVRKAVFLAIVPAVLITDRLPLATSFAVFLPVWSLQFALNGYANTLLARGNSRYLMTEFFDLTKMFAFLKASLTLLTGRQVRFRVTPKGGGFVDLGLSRLLAPYVALVWIYVMSVLVGIARVSGLLTTQSRTAQAVGLLWALAIVGVLVSVIVYGFKKVSQRSEDRVDVHLPVRYRSAYSREERLGVVENLTTSGCALRTAEPPPFDRRVFVRVSNPPILLRGTVRSVRKRPEGYVSGLSFKTTQATATQIAGILTASILSDAPPSYVAAIPPAERPLAA